MSRTCYLLALATFTAIPVGSALAAGSYTEQLAQFDRNGNGFLEAHERAAMQAAAAEQATLSTAPVVCEAEAEGEASSAGGRGGNNAQQQQEQQPQVVRHARLRWEQLAPNDQQPADQPAAEEEQQAESPEGYTPQAPAPKPPVARTSRSAYYTSLQLREPPQAPPRPQPFAQAATFGPMVGRAKQYPHRYFTVAAHDTCACSRASLYFGGN